MQSAMREEVFRERAEEPYSGPRNQSLKRCCAGRQDCGDNTFVQLNGKDSLVKQRSIRYCRIDAFEVIPDVIQEVLASGYD